MTVSVLHTPSAAQLRPSQLLESLLAAWHEHQRRAAARRDLAHASRLGPRLLADMGLAPADASPLVGDWDTLLPNGYLVKRIR